MNGAVNLSKNGVGTAVSFGATTTILYNNMVIDAAICIDPDVKHMSINNGTFVGLSKRQYKVIWRVLSFMFWLDNKRSLFK